jgi:HD-GYP domain-containing protein (c-di-GMP phosphodiesterase class II)
MTCTSIRGAAAAEQLGESEVQIDHYHTPDAEALLTLPEQRTAGYRNRRDIAIEAGAASTLLLAASLFAALAPWQRPLSLTALVAVVATWVVIERVSFPVAGGFTHPTMLAFVPALFVLPTPIVPLTAIGCVLTRAIPAVLGRRAAPTMLLCVVADAWFAIGPAAVVVLAGADRFAWSHWPAYVAAMAVEVGLDATATTVRSWFGERVSPRVQLPLLAWVYISDLTLAPLGLVIAAAAVQRPGLVTIALAPLVTLWLFARERRERMEETLALSTAYRGTALLLGDIVEADDHYTGMHSRDVVDLSIAVACELELDSAVRRRVEFAALLHDVGKIRIPKHIINKGGPLDQEEWMLVRRHTIDGERMLQMVGGTLGEVGRIVRATHERYDGEGYPDGLAGEQIPIEARIISACDAFSAMTTDRAYRPALTPREALAELRRCSGRQFDPRVVAAIELIMAPRHGWWLDMLGAPRAGALAGSRLDTLGAPWADAATGSKVDPPAAASDLVGASTSVQ